MTPWCVIEIGLCIALTAQRDAASGGGPLNYRLSSTARGASTPAPGAFSFTQVRCAAGSFGGLVRIAKGTSLPCRRSHSGAQGRRRQHILSREHGRIPSTLTGSRQSSLPVFLEMRGRHRPRSGHSPPVAQQANKLPTVAVLGDLASVWNPWTGAFADRMGELGSIAGRNIAIEYRWSEGRQAPVAEIAFVRQKST